MISRLSFVALFLFCVLTAVALHYRGFEGSFVLDSIPNVAENRHVFATEPLVGSFRLFPTRCVAMWSFAANHAITGTQPFYYRLSNAILLAATAFQLFLLALAILSLPSNDSSLDRKERLCLAALPASMFLVHPLQSFVVVYVVQRMALLACFFYMASLTAYLYTETGRFRSAAVGYAICGVFFLCALFSKENAITLPIVFLIAHAALFKNSPRTIRNTVVLLAIIGCLTLSMLAVHQMLFRADGQEGVLQVVAWNYLGSGLSVWQVAMSQARLFFRHVQDVLAPFSSHLALVDAVEISRSILEPYSTLVALVGLGGWVVVGLAMLRLRPLMGFGLLYFAIALVPESLADPKLLFLSYRGVLPMPGLLLALMDAVRWVLERTRSKPYARTARAILIGSFSLWLILAAAVTLKTSELWRDRVDLWRQCADGIPNHSDNVEKSPRALIYCNLSSSLLDAGKADEAIALTSKALKINPRMVSCIATLSNAYLQKGMLPESEHWCRKAIELDPYSARYYNNLGAIFLRRGESEEAAKWFKKAADMAPWSGAIVMHLGKALLAQGKVDEAIPLFEKACAMSGTSAEPLKNLGVALMRANRPEQAVLKLQQAVRLKPDYADALANLGFALTAAGRRSEAMAPLRKALDLKPKMYGARYVLANLLLVAGRFDEAVEQYGIVLEADPKNPLAHNNAGAALMRAGRYKEALRHFRTALKIRPGMAEAIKNIEEVKRLQSSGRPGNGQ